MMMGGQGAATVESTRINQIPRPRYLHVKEQARHLPVGMRLIVDQNHINDILAAVANSRLRIQVTQVSMLHMPNVQRSSHESATTASGGMGGVGGMASSGLRPAGSPAAGLLGGMSMGSGGRGSMSPPAGMGPRSGGDLRGSGSGRPTTGPASSGRPGMTGPQPYGPSGPRPGGAGGTPDPTVGQPVDNARLVELVIYGLATLYERFPARPKDATPGAPAGTPTTTPAKP
jgi:hypothetical protein